MRVCMARATGTYSFGQMMGGIASLTLLVIVDATIGIDIETTFAINQEDEKILFRAH